VDNFFETFYSYVVRDALDVSFAFSAHGRVEDHPNVPGLSQVWHASFQVLRAQGPAMMLHRCVSVLALRV
jgi:hypothetical protein